MTADSILDLPIATAVVPSADDAGCGEPDVEARCGDVRSKRRPWSPEEDTQLKELVERHGIKSWAIIATQLCLRLYQRPTLLHHCRSCPVDAVHRQRRLRSCGSCETP